MTRIGYKIIIAGASALVLAAGTGGATAAMMSSPTPVDSFGVIHGCYANTAIDGSHIFWLQNAETNCGKGTTAIAWNQQGPAGPSVDIGTVTWDAGSCSLSNLSGPSHADLTVAPNTPGDPAYVTGCVVSGFDSTAPMVFVTTTFYQDGPEEGPGPAIAYSDGEPAGSVLIGFNPDLLSANQVSWNFLAYAG